MEQQADVGCGDVAMATPVYESVNGTVVRTDAVVARPYRVTIPDRVVADYTSPEIRPVQLDVVPLLYPHPQILCAAIRITRTEPGGTRTRWRPADCGDCRDVFCVRGTDPNVGRAFCEKMRKVGWSSVRQRGGQTLG